MILRRFRDWPTWDWDDPFDELDRMRRQIDRLMEGVPRFGEPIAGVFPLTNITEDKDNYYLRAELPGISAEDLEISVTGSTLSLEGERKIPEAENARYHRRERESGKFSRVLTLPSQIDSEKVEAHSTDGILTVKLPKSEAAKPRQITVKTS